MKQTLVKKYVYNAYVFNIAVILNSKSDEKNYIHEVSATGKDYFEATECTSKTLSKTVESIESNINKFVDSKTFVSEEESYLLENGFVRISY